MSPEEHLLVLSSLSPLDLSEQKRFKHLAVQPGLDWALVGELAELNKVEPRLTSVLKFHGVWDVVPRQVADRLAQVAQTVAETNRKRVARAEQLFAAFHEARIEFCVLKGVLFAETLYGDPLYKRMNDIDMLVHPPDVPRIVEIYARLGYFSIGERVANRPELNQKVSHHLPPYVNRELDCILGTQWALKSPRAGLNIDSPAMWSRIEAHDYRGHPIHKLSSRDNLFHVCVHLGVFKSGLRDLMDIANLIRQESGRIDWPAFIDDVRRARAESHVVHALTLVHCLDPRPETAAALDALRPNASGFYLEAAKKKARAPSVLLRTCSAHLSTVEKHVSEFNVANYFPEKSRRFLDFWQSVLLAPRAECGRVTFTPEPTGVRAVMARVAAPAQIFRAIGAEVGNGLVAALMIKSVIDLGTSFAKWPFTSQHETNLAAYAHSLGLTVADLERIKDSIH
ncbi:MAG: nucleotidyltransferase family protein [Myxococcales bacterium]|nr:nucleotidyltransferase family protein [Myxococcales bacterium]